ncbi:response regulator [Nocardia sp. CA2R105]|uniref:response regulator n=1 Tax=Nocardia coffeae TaxID=2873381 RepID=UPI001CA71F08|nr:response regulator [Nocardia coffeae]MBY8861277.1 response regulator [Nocardia coffeae]
MIRTLVVDDDPMAVSVHRQFTERVEGFEVIGEATCGAAALRAVQSQQPELLLLDMYLPDLDGLEVLRRLRGSSAPVDVIAITSAKDVDVLRSAMHLGVVHYVVKPFTFRTFRERLDSYAAARAQLDRMRAPAQGDIDRLYGRLRSSGEQSLPKGISAATLTHVTDTVRALADGLTASELSERVGFSHAAARRYLKFLHDTGAVQVALRYGAAGRPEHLYRWSGT